MGYGKRRSRTPGLLMVVFFCFTANTIKAQSITQLIEQLTLDVQKLSELKTILEDMKEGYQVLDKGYTNIHDIVKGNFSLHKAFLDELLTVSTPVRQYYKVASILDNERSIVMESQKANRRWTTSGLFTPAELEHIDRLYRTLSDKGSQCLDRLTMVITAAELRMSDAERMQTIDRIHADVTGQLAGLRRFNDELTIQALQRGRELNNIKTLNGIYGNHP